MASYLVCTDCVSRTRPGLEQNDVVDIMWEFGFTQFTLFNSLILPFLGIGQFPFRVSVGYNVGSMKTDMQNKMGQTIGNIEYTPLKRRTIFLFYLVYFTWYNVQLAPFFHRDQGE